MKVVDTQVMLHRATDYAKESSLQQKRNDVAQQLLKDQGQQETIRKAAEVQSMDKEEAQQAIRRDTGDSGGARQEKKGRKKNDTTEKPILDERNPLLAEMSLESRFIEPGPRIDIDI